MQKINIRELPTPKNGNLSWMVDTKVDGRRKQRYFRTRSDADQFARGLRIQFAKGDDFVLTAAEKGALIEARAILEPLGKTLRDMLEFYQTFATDTARVGTCAEVADHFLNRKRLEKVSGDHHDDLRLRLSHFNERFADRPIATVSAQDLNEWLEYVVAPKESGGRGLSITSCRNYRKAVSGLFGFAFREDFTKRNVMEKVFNPAKEFTDIGILTLPEFRRFMRAVASRPSIIAPIAIGFFLGVRTEEIMRLKTDDIRMDRRKIDLKGKNTKGRRRGAAARRVLEIDDTLYSWLRQVPNIEEPGHFLIPSIHRWREQTGEARAEAGIEWPNNCMRHCFASYHIELHQDAAKTALILGHADSGILFQHYRELIDNHDDAVDYFATSFEV